MNITDRIAQKIAIAVAESLDARNRRAARRPSTIPALYGIELSPLEFGTSGRIVRCLRKRGGWVPKTEIRRIVSVPSAEIDSWLSYLVDAGVIEARAVATATRPRMEYRLRMKGGDTDQPE